MEIYFFFRQVTMHGFVRKNFEIYMPDSSESTPKVPGVEERPSSSGKIDEKESKDKEKKEENLFDLTIWDSTTPAITQENKEERKKKIKEINSRKTINSTKVGDFTFYDVDFKGELKDHIKILIKSDQIMFMTKRYARSNDSRLMVKLTDDINHTLKKRKQRLKFSHKDDFQDFLQFDCFENPKGKNYKATLTYEFFPNIVYNINFFPTCASFNELINNGSQVLIDGRALNPNEMPQGKIIFIFFRSG